MAAPSISEVRLRPATLDDAAACAAIYRVHVETGTGTFETEAPDSVEMAARMEKCLARGWPWLVAERGHETLGFAYAGQFRDRAAYAHCGETSIYVASGQEGQGIGRQLMAALLDASRRAGYRQMIAVIGDSENHASIGLHRAFGFHHVGIMEKVGLKFGRWLDVVLMQRGLD